MLLSFESFPQSGFKNVDDLFKNGEFKKAASEIYGLLSDSKLSPSQVYDLRFTLDLMERIKKDFTKSREEVKAFLVKYYPAVTNEQLDAWEAKRALEVKLIDGEKKYFKLAARNLFRIDKEAKKRWEEVEGKSPDLLDEFLLDLLPDVIKESKKRDNRLVKPVTIKVKYTLTVKPNAVPSGEIVRCWLPYPAEVRDRQTGVELISANYENFVISPYTTTHRSVYLEAPAEKDSPLVFEVEYKYRAYSEFNNIDFTKKYTIDTSSDLYDIYTAERLPHIPFTDELKALSAKIIGGETEPIKKFKLIYEWINDNIPWAGALEYSTIPDIASYCYQNMHGDCGIQSLLFITLCRMNGIPAKWQSGWMLHPPEVNLHDWAEVYFNETGWIPVDQSFKLKPSDDPVVRYYYLGNTDNYHFIVNDDFSGEFFPAKIHPRSETIDFQRGEVEWRGGNLYFDKWNYNIYLDYTSEN
ncbi:MAG: transglutaminase domain-containing protein [Ignavibacteria bacterium]|nr:transglutaminase domain-containing protein [Ignavibacteria bacterium]